MKKQRRSTPKVKGEKEEKSTAGRVVNGAASFLGACVGGLAGGFVAVVGLAISTDAREIWRRLRQEFPNESQQMLLDVFEEWTSWEVQHGRMSREVWRRFLHFIRMQRSELAFIEPRFEGERFFQKLFLGSDPAELRVRAYLMSLPPMLYI